MRHSGAPQLHLLLLLLQALAEARHARRGLGVWLLLLLLGWRRLHRARGGLLQCAARALLHHSRERGWQRGGKWFCRCTGTWRWRRPSCRGAGGCCGLWRCAATTTTTTAQQKAALEAAGARGALLLGRALWWRAPRCCCRCRMLRRCCCCCCCCTRPWHPTGAPRCLLCQLQLLHALHESLKRIRLILPLALLRCLQQLAPAARHVRCASSSCCCCCCWPLRSRGARPRRWRCCHPLQHPPLLPLVLVNVDKGRHLLLLARNPTTTITSGRPSALQACQQRAQRLRALLLLLRGERAARRHVPARCWCRAAAAAACALLALRCRRALRGRARWCRLPWPLGTRRLLAWLQAVCCLYRAAPLHLASPAAAGHPHVLRVGELSLEEGHPPTRHLRRWGGGRKVGERRRQAAAAASGGDASLTITGAPSLSGSSRRSWATASRSRCAPASSLERWLPAMREPAGAACALPWLACLQRCRWGQGVVDARRSGLVRRRRCPSSQRAARLLPPLLLLLLHPVVMLFHGINTATARQVGGGGAGKGCRRVCAVQQARGAVVGWWCRGGGGAAVVAPHQAQIKVHKGGGRGAYAHKEGGQGGRGGGSAPHRAYAWMSLTLCCCLPRCFPPAPSLPPPPPPPPLLLYNPPLNAGCAASSPAAPGVPGAATGLRLSRRTSCVLPAPPPPPPAGRGSACASGAGARRSGGARGLRARGARRSLPLPSSPPPRLCCTTCWPAPCASSSSHAPCPPPCSPSCCCCPCGCCWCWGWGVPSPVALPPDSRATMEMI